MNISQITKALLHQISDKIIEQVNLELDGKQKKTKVDSAICLWISENTLGLGLIQKFVINKYLLPVIPVITQSLYDCLKKQISGLTENGKV